MMTLNRFKTLADSYGAEFERWPAEWRQDAESLLGTSAEAQQIFAAAAETDAMLLSIREAEAALWSEPEEAASLARLRAGVADAIARQGMVRTPRKPWRGLAPLHGGVAAVQAHLSWLVWATSGGAAIASGLLIGSLSGQSGLPDCVLSLMQTAPLHVFPL